MSNSLAYHIRLACDFCDQSIEFDCWFLVDGAARPDLIEKARAGTLHDCVCPHCFHVNRINSPLMLYRPQQTPVLLFSPADGSEHAENRKQISRMCGTLRKNLGDQWDESWFSGGVIAVLRNHLPAVLYGSSPYLQGQEVRNVRVRNVRPGELLQGGDAESHRGEPGRAHRRDGPPIGRDPEEDRQERKWGCVEDL